MAEQTAPTESSTPKDDGAENTHHTRVKGWIEASKSKRKDLVKDWATNVDYRRGKPFETDSDEDRVAVNLDWSMTKSKHAQMFSVVPEVRATEKNPLYKPAAAPFATQINEQVKLAKVEVAMDECMSDVINAAGVCAVLISQESITEPRSIPAIDPSTLSPLHQIAVKAGLMKLPMKTIDYVIDSRRRALRISPGDLLWPSNYKHSDFDEGPWIGHSGECTRGEGARRFKLNKDDLDSAKASTGKNSTETLTPSNEHREPDDNDTIGFDEIFYRRHLFHSDEKYFTAIQHVVFVNGIAKPVIDEPWKGQQFIQDPKTGKGTYLGSCRFPIQACTLTYISDEPIPPSDSAIGRPQVNELMRSRTQMVQQRDHVKPMRWGDVNRLDPLVLDAMMKGKWQQVIPVQGDGTRVIGEVARATYPREDFEFDRIGKADLQELSGLGANQTGNFASGERSASEAQIVQTNFQTRIGYERGKVTKFFLGIVEVLAGLYSLYGDFELPNISDEDRQRLGTGWDRKRINHAFAFNIRPDSTVLLDAEQRIARATRFLNVAGKSGYVDVEPILAEIADLSGYDSAKVVRRPPPSGPDASSISVRFDGADLANPLALAMLVETKQAPRPESLEAAINMLTEVQRRNPVSPVQMVKAGDTPAPIPLLAPNADAEPPAPAMTMAPGAGAPPPGGEALPPAGEAHPEWNTMPRINTRRDSSEE